MDLLPGLRPEPLLTYSAALGLHRVLVEQRPHWLPRSCWRGDCFALQLNDADLEDLKAFLVRDYSPTPIISIWNGRASLAEGKNAAYQQNLADLEAHSEQFPRLSALGSTITRARELWSEAERRELLSGDGKVIDKRKGEFLRLYRSRMPDAAVDWLDAAIAILDEDEAYPLMTGGTGGNIGSGDLSVNYLKDLHRLFVDPVGNDKKQQHVEALVDQALLGTTGKPLYPTSAFHFDFGSTAGATRSNPWLKVLAMEGAVLFSASVARNLSSEASQQAKAAMPFTVGRTSLGYPSASPDEDVKGEIWAPLWTTPMSGHAVRSLISEGRARWNGRQARNGLDFLRALGSFGVDQSISEFARYVFAVRFGQNVVAVPAGRYRVEAMAGLSATASADSWLARVPRSRVSPAVLAARRTVDRALWRFSETGDPQAAAGILSGLYDLEQALFRSPKTRDSVPRPISGLKVEDWIGSMNQLVESSAEFRVAAALASQHDLGDEPGRPRQYFADLIRPIERTRSGSLQFSSNNRAARLGIEPLVHVLTQVLRKRAVHAVDRALPNGLDELSRPGIALGFDFTHPAPLVDVADFAAGHLDDSLVETYLKGLVMLDWRFGPPEFKLTGKSGARWSERSGTNSTWASAAPLCSKWAIRQLAKGEATAPQIPVSSPLVTALALGRGDEGLGLIGRTYRGAGFDLAVRPGGHTSKGATQRAAAALLVPITEGAANRLRREACPHPDDPKPPSHQADQGSNP